MKILILGAGQVGSSAAYHLSREEANEVTVVDMRPDVLRELQDRLDIRTVVGHAAYPETLERAGAADADIVVALTDSDETNMVACQVAYTQFRTPTKIARIRSAEYMNADRLFTQDAIPIDVRISLSALSWSSSYSTRAPPRFSISPMVVFGSSASRRIATVCLSVSASRR